MGLLRHLAQNRIRILVLGVTALDAMLYVLDRGHSVWNTAHATILMSQTALLAAFAMLVPWNRRFIFPVVALIGVLMLGFVTRGDEAAKMLLTLAVATALWPVPARLSGRRLMRRNDPNERLPGDNTHSLYLWFLMMTVIGGWIIIVQRFPGPIGDRPYLVATSLGSFLGIRIVLSQWPWRVWASLYIGVMFVVGFGAMLVSADAAATMNWTAPPIHGRLAPIWSPVEFVTTRLENLRYLDMLNVGLIWLATFFAITTTMLLMLRVAGHRILPVDYR
jgi:hypothetical protein